MSATRPGGATVPVWFDDDEFEIIAAACERLLPGDAATGAPGARSAHLAEYLDTLLGAFSFDPPRIWAGGPFSGRHGGEPAFEQWVPLDPLDELAWRTRLEGSQGRPEREFNGPVVGWHERYRDGVAALGRDFVDVHPDEQDRRLHAAADFTALVYEQACEGRYGDPVYGGNHGQVGWTFIAFPGDVQPEGYTDESVRGAEVGSSEVDHREAAREE